MTDMPTASKITAAVFAEEVAPETKASSRGRINTAITA